MGHDGRVYVAAIELNVNQYHQLDQRGGLKNSRVTTHTRNRLIHHHSDQKSDYHDSSTNSGTARKLPPCARDQNYITSIGSYNYRRGLRRQRTVLPVVGAGMSACRGQAVSSSNSVLLSSCLLNYTELPPPAKTTTSITQTGNDHQCYFDPGER